MRHRHPRIAALSYLIIVAKIFAGFSILRSDDQEVLKPIDFESLKRPDLVLCEREVKLMDYVGAKNPFKSSKFSGGSRFAVFGKEMTDELWLQLLPLDSLYCTAGEPKWAPVSVLESAGIRRIIPQFAYGITPCERRQLFRSYMTRMTWCDREAGRRVPLDSLGMLLGAEFELKSDVPSYQMAYMSLSAANLLKKEDRLIIPSGSWVYVSNIRRPSAVDGVELADSVPWYEVVVYADDDWLSRYKKLVGLPESFNNFQASAWIDGASLRGQFGHLSDSLQLIKRARWLDSCLSSFTATHDSLPADFWDSLVVEGIRKNWEDRGY